MYAFFVQNKKRGAGGDENLGINFILPKREKV
jgi:hypothetical protein